MTEPDAGVLMFLGTVNETSCRGENPARVNDEPDGDCVKQFVDSAAFAMESGVDGSHPTGPAWH